MSFPKQFSIYCKYVVNMENKKMYSIRIHIKQLNYLRNIANKNFTTVTQYILDLINKDMKNTLKNE